ncbi:MAG: DUF423 domain-containing protein [Alphaproteobacteria bacterium]
MADPRGAELFRIGSRYQMWHALALLGVAGLERTRAAGRPCSPWRDGRFSSESCCSRAGCICSP